MRSVLGLAGAAFLVYSAVRLRVSLSPVRSRVSCLPVRVCKACMFAVTRAWGQAAAERTATAAGGLHHRVREPRFILAEFMDSWFTLQLLWPVLSVCMQVMASSSVSGATE